VSTTLEAALETLGLNIYPVPILPGTKRPPMAGWQNLRLTADDLEKHFGNGNGLGWLLGIEPRPIADVDADSKEALSLLPLIAGPKTDRVFGREGNPSSHHLFEVCGEFDSAQFKDPVLVKLKHSKPMIIELRGRGGQTVMPPTVHESGEPIEWVRSGDFGKATFSELRCWVAKIAAAALLVRYWPSGHEARLALAGMLARAEWNEDDAVEFVSAILGVAQPHHDRELKHDVQNCYKRVRQDKKSFGRSKFEELLGENGGLIVGTAADWLEIRTLQGPQKQFATSAEITLENFANIKREKVSWLWPGKIAFGKLNLFVGDPSQGKSLISLDTVARMTLSAAFPDGAAGFSGEALIISCEDDASDTVAPRLHHAGAEMSRVHRLKAVKVTLPDGQIGQSFFSLERDIEKLEDSLEKFPAIKLIIIDPVSAYMGKVDSWKDTEVRAILEPLSDMAARKKIAIVGILHLRKSEASALLRISGSIAFVAAARIVWGFGTDPDNPERHVMICVKNNLGKKPPPLAYEIIGAKDDPEIGIVAWLRDVKITVTADDVLGSSLARKRNHGETLAKAETWLRNLLQNGPVPQTHIEREADREGLSWRTVRRAKKTLEVKSKKASFGGAWMWELESDEGAEWTIPLN
jgi:hypothetical protein